MTITTDPTAIADEIAGRLWAERAPMFVQKHYNRGFAILSLIEDRAGRIGRMTRAAVCPVGVARQHGYAGRVREQAGECEHIFLIGAAATITAHGNGEFAAGKDGELLSLGVGFQCDLRMDRGNIARFINHSCDPNCITQKWNVLGEVMVGIFAIKNIHPDEELTFDYKFDVYKTPFLACLCGAKNCKGYLGLLEAPPEQIGRAHV